MKRVHFSSKPIKLIRSEKQLNKGGFFGKPNGFWYSIEGNGDGWSDWTAAEDFTDTNTQIAYELEVDLSKCIVISNKAELKTFTEKYKLIRPSYHAIDWKKVARDYSGIEINPYIPTYELDSQFVWYYGWDCASGCVWDSRIIEIIGSI